MFDASKPAFDTPWRDLLAVRIGGTYHLLRPEINSRLTLCDLTFGIERPVMSLPLPRDYSCDACMTELRNAVFGA